MTTSEPERGEIWLVRYRYYDRATAVPRPAVCIDWDRQRGEGIFSKITKHDPRSEDSGDLALLDWAYEGLKLPSTARCSQVQLVPAEAVYRRFGFLADNDFMRVFHKLEQQHPLLFL